MSNGHTLRVWRLFVGRGRRRLRCNLASAAGRCAQPSQASKLWLSTKCSMRRRCGSGRRGRARAPGPAIDVRAGLRPAGRRPSACHGRPSQLRRRRRPRRRPRSRLLWVCGTGRPPARSAREPRLGGRAWLPRTSSRHPPAQRRRSQPQQLFSIWSFVSSSRYLFVTRTPCGSSASVLA